MICAVLPYNNTSNNTVGLYRDRLSGPLIINHKIAGIMSYLEENTARDNTSYYINVYTKVSNFREWIDRLIEC